MSRHPERVEPVRSEGLQGEPVRLFDERSQEGFWDRFIRPGPVVDIGYKGATGSAPIFRDAVGIDLDTPGYDGRNLPFEAESVGSIHASHVLEHIADYGHFLRECFRVLNYEGTLLLFVPLMEAYEARSVPPSAFNQDHKRFYTSSRLLFEIETSLIRECYRVIHLRERFRPADLARAQGQHAAGPYEIECVLEKLRPDGVY